MDAMAVDNPHLYQHHDEDIGDEDSQADDDPVLDIIRQSSSLIAQVVATAAQATTTALNIYAEQHFFKRPYHTSILTGHGWVQELLTGHPDRIRCELGVRKHVFEALLTSLENAGYMDSRRGVTLVEQLAIFLYTCVTGLSLRHVGEHFQRSNETISRYFREMLHFFADTPFYTEHVRLPDPDAPTPPQIRGNPKLYPFFKDAIGAIDGTHVPCMPSRSERAAARDYKGQLTQNCLAACTFDMRFVYMYTGWEGSATDTYIYHEARVQDLYIPPGKFYLADAGFPACHGLVIPFRQTRYHLAEWGRARLRPRNQEELFNLRHAQARNIVERIFGVLKRRFRILYMPPEFDMRIQVQVPAALACLHNFIRIHDEDDINDFGAEVEDLRPGAYVGELATGVPGNAERSASRGLRDEIAHAMWVQYQETIGQRRNHADEPTV